MQAPKRRAEPCRVGGDRLRRYGFAGLAAAVVVGVAVALSIVLSGGGTSGKGVAAAMQAAGCTFKTYPSQGRSHVNNVNAKIKYNSFPPTSGPHYFQPIPWGIYPTSFSQVQGVHNLEHGGILIQYGRKVPRTTVDKMTAFVDSDPRGMLMAPLPELGARVALTAWTHLSTCTRFDDEAFKTFRDAFRAKGPERFPLNDLQPGS